MNVEIKDTRVEQDFRSSSFSGYKKCDVKRELLKSLSLSKIEPACYWSAELICSGHFTDLWENIILFYSKNIHIGNPKLAIYIELKIRQFKEIVHTGYTNNELLMRNNENIRDLFAELICILCVSSKKHSYDSIQITKDAYDLTNSKNLLKAPSIEYGRKWIQEGDPKGIIISINELSYHLSKEGGNTLKACYWVEWIIEYSNICHKKKEDCLIVARNTIPVSEKDQCNLVWLIWDVFKGEAKTRSKMMERIVDSLFHIFTLRYTSACNKRRRYIMYLLCSMFCDHVDLEQNIVSDPDKKMIANITKKIENIYKQIKSNEHIDLSLVDSTPRTEEEKTIKKIEIFNDFGGKYIPRV